VLLRVKIRSKRFENSLLNFLIFFFFKYLTSERIYYIILSRFERIKTYSVKYEKKRIHQQKISSVKSSELIPELTINWLTDLNHVPTNIIIWNR